MANKTKTTGDRVNDHRSVHRPGENPRNANVKNVTRAVKPNRLWAVLWHDVLFDVDRMRVFVSRGAARIHLGWVRENEGSAKLVTYAAVSR